METKLQTLKNELKELASRIHTAKHERKTVRFTGTRTIRSKYSHLTDAQYAAYLARELGEEFRHKHIAYCMIRGKTYEQIEQFGGPELSWSWIKDLITEYDFTPEQKEAFARKKELVA
jgi:secreted Zn-dependent insulinase-like peptidase